MTDKKQDDPLKALAEEGQAIDIADTNDRLASIANTDDDFVKASLRANNPVGSSSAYRDPKAEKKVRDANDREDAKAEKN